MCNQVGGRGGVIEGYVSSTELQLICRSCPCVFVLGCSAVRLGADRNSAFSKNLRCANLLSPAQELTAL